MQLFIVQHGDAVPKDVDPDRPLSDKGRSDIQRLAEWLSQHEIRVAQIFHSGKTRARETAEILQSLLEPGGDMGERQGLAPNDPPADFFQGLKTTEKVTLVAGHMPFVARAVSQALTGTPDSDLVDFAPGSIAGIQRGAGDAWRIFMFLRPENL